MKIKQYHPSMEAEWIQVKAELASISHTWDFVCRTKECFNNAALSLVATENNVILGILDAEIEPSPGAICWNRDGRGANVHEFGILPAYQHRGIASSLLERMSLDLRAMDIFRAEFWTKDPKAIAYYREKGFRPIFTQTHFRFKPATESNAIRPIYAYGILTEDKETPSAKSLAVDIIENHPYETHECMGFEWHL